MEPLPACPANFDTPTQWTHSRKRKAADAHATKYTKALPEMKLEPDEVDHDVTFNITHEPQVYTETRYGPGEGIDEGAPSRPLADSNGLDIPFMLAGVVVLVLLVWLADALRTRREKSASGRHDQRLH